MVTKVQRAYKFRFYPTQAQRQQLAIEFGCSRFVWNKALELRGKAWEENKERHNYVSLSKIVTQWKRGEFPWLAEASACCIQQTLINQDKAFEAFFRRVKAGEKPGYPKFKSRFDRQSVRYTLDNRRIASQFCAGDYLKLPKLGYVKLKWSRIPEGTPKMVTVSKDQSGRYFVSFMCEVEVKPLPLTGKSIGVDLGIKDVTVTSEGAKSGNPRHLKGLLRHLKRQQRFLARKKKGSRRRERQRVRVAKVHAKIAACRKDFLHKTTTELVRSADVIALENLNVSGMLKNHNLAGAIADVGMGELRRQIEYKARWYGRKVVIADRWGPTSKTCSDCGFQQPGITLKVREWTCPGCGAHHDRDINAAKNILIFAVGNTATAHRGSKNLSGLPGTPVEVRTDETHIVTCLERAAV